MHRFLVLSLLSLLAGLAHGQIEVGGKAFERSLTEAGQDGSWVLYERGAPQNDATRRWLTKQVLVERTAALQDDRVRALNGVRRTEDRGTYLLVEFDGAADVALEGARRLRALPGVKGAEPMLARQLHYRHTPNDPLFSYNAAEEGYQWHLNNTGQNEGTAGIDVNVTDTWDSYQGSGVRIAIVDDGLQTDHPDLVANMDLVHSYDFNGDDADPSPGEDNPHGTACAGVAAARGDNNLGGLGVAPQASLVGMKLIAAPTTDAQEADAMAHAKDVIDIKSNSWGPYDGAYGMGGPGPLAAAAIEDGALTGRAGKGTIYLWASGNGNGSGDDSNYDGWANTPYAIAVSAINDRGTEAWYSEPGSNILICAPSNGGTQGVTTTDRTGDDGYNDGDPPAAFPNYADADYTNSFGGTSSATPAVAGVVALMLEANPNLTYRDVQEILVRTATKNDPYDGDWVRNGGGLEFNINYGAGLVNAEAAVSRAESWTNVDPVQTHSLNTGTVNLAIPDFDPDGVSHTLFVPSTNSLRLEHVTVKVKATHPYRGNVEWRLTSPSGVSVRLARSRFNDVGEDLDWTFMSTHFWGERSEGDWKLTAIDNRVGDVGTLDEAEITFYGTPHGSGLPLPVITSGLVLVAREGAAFEHQMTAAHSPTSFGAQGLPDGLSIDTSTGLISGTPTGPAGILGLLEATNASGSVSEFAEFYVLAADAALSTAVEQPTSLKIVPFGFAHFFSQSDTTFDGIDAAQSGEVDDDEYSGMEFTVEGPARLSFRWKVSSEKNYDYLVLAVDGRVLDFITGEIDWTQVSHDLGSGTHNVDIYYLKDQAVTKGEDAGWVDEMAISPITAPPALTVDPIQAYEGVPFRHVLEATHAPHSYTADNLPAGLTLHAPTGLIYGSVAAAGSYPVTFHATNDFGTDTEIITLEVGTVASGLAEAVDLPSQSIATSGDLGWQPQWTYASDEEDAARSGAIEDLEESVMTTTVSGPCKIGFVWGVSSEADYDFLRFYIDDVEQDAISGEVGWTRMGYLLEAGSHTLKWVFSKDDYTRSGLDSGFVDQFGIYHDNDGDGHYTDMEDHFGTSDADPDDQPKSGIDFTVDGPRVTFPSVAGHEYRISYSEDLKSWTSEIITATGSTTTWTDPNADGLSRRFYKVSIP